MAVKICDAGTERESDEAIEREAELQRAVLHSNIAQIYEIIRHEGKVYIFMEYCKNGELFDRINR